MNPSIKTSLIVGWTILATLCAAAQEPTQPTLRSNPLPQAYTALDQIQTQFLLRALGDDRTAANCLVVPPPGGAPDSLAEIQEDLNIMGHIFDRFLQQARLVPLPGASLFAPERPRTSAVYLAGSAVLFLIEVNVALVGPEPAPSPKPQGTDPLWEEVRADMQGSRSGPGTTETALSMPAYDSATVDRLKRTLLKAAAHAWNIRHLAPQSEIVVVVMESRPSSLSIARRLTTSDQNPANWLRSAAPAYERAALTFRVSKADVTMLAQGQRDVNELLNTVRFVGFGLAAMPDQRF